MNHPFSENQLRQIMEVARLALSSDAFLFDSASSLGYTPTHMTGMKLALDGHLGMVTQTPIEEPLVELPSNTFERRIELRLRMAEILGWHRCSHEGHCLVVGIPPGIDENDTRSTTIVPSWPSDMSAMNDAWLWLRAGHSGSELIDEGRRTSYGEHLSEFARAFAAKFGGAYDYVLANLPEYLRAEAFVKAFEGESKNHQKGEQPS